MIEWTVFYRMLGVKDFGENGPSDEQLLGIGGVCDSAGIDEALRARRRVVRQNIPGPEFVSLVRRFEREVLEKAALRLKSGTSIKSGSADGAQSRGAGHLAIAGRRDLPVVDKGAAEKRARKDKVRQVILGSLGDNNTLAKRDRPALALKLGSLGVSRDKVKAILGRIPLPANEAVRSQLGTIRFFAEAVDLRLFDGVLRKSDDAELAELGEHLGLSERKVRRIIEHRLGVNNARRSEVSLRNVLSLALPAGIAAVLVIGALILGPALIGAGRVDEADSAVDEDVRVVQEDAAVEREKLAVREKVLEDEPKVVEDESAALSDAGSTEQVGEVKVKVEEPREPARNAGVDLNMVAGYSADVVEGFAEPGQMEGMLADLALTTMACCHESGNIVYEVSGMGGDLARFADASDRVGALGGTLTGLADMGKSFAAGSGVDEQRLVVLGDKLADADKAERYRAINELANIEDERVDEVLLEGIRANDGRTDRRATVCRILRRLEQSTSAKTGFRLAELIESSSAGTAHQITMTLSRMAGARDGRAVLAARHDRDERVKAARRWQRFLAFKMLADENAGALVDDQVRAEMGGDQLNAAESDRDFVRQKLLAAMAGYAKKTAGNLAVVEGDIEGGSLNNANSVSVEAGGNLSKQLERGFGEVTERLMRIVRQKGTRTEQAVAVDIIELEREVRLLACESVLQKVAVETDAQGRLLEMLIGFVDQDRRYRGHIAELNEQGTGSRGANVLEEIRGNQYRNMVMWQILNKALERND